MTFLEKLDNLMHEKKLNKHTLAEQCGVPYTTIVGLYERGPDNARLSTLTKICGYFNVPLDYMVYDRYEKVSDFVPAGIKHENLSDEENHVMALYRGADPVYRKVVVEILTDHQIPKEQESLA